jgi:hypothetical protein
MARVTRATTKAAMAMATRMTETRATTLEEMTANGDKESTRVDNNQLRQRQRQGL